MPRRLISLVLFGLFLAGCGGEVTGVPDDDPGGRPMGEDPGGGLPPVGLPDAGSPSDLPDAAPIDAAPPAPDADPGGGGGGGGGGSDGDVGDACDKDSECPCGFCLEEDKGFPGGYCTKGCSHGGCPSGTTCVKWYQGGTKKRLTCAAKCLLSAQDPCRSGYECRDVGLSHDKGICWPRN